MNKSEHNQNQAHDDQEWVKVMETFGVSQTEMIVDYLREQGVNAMAVGSRSLGLITGANAGAQVIVPEEDVELTMQLLEPDEDTQGNGGALEETDTTASFSGATKAVLGATALVFSPLGAGIAYAASRSVDSEEETGHGLIDCPNCGTGLELSDEELEQRQFICPDCNLMTRLDDYTVCPYCQSELDLDENEKSRGWYICPECRWAVRIALPLADDHQ